MQCWYGHKAQWAIGAHWHTYILTLRCFAKKQKKQTHVDLLIGHLDTLKCCILWFSHLSAVRSVGIFPVLPRSVDEKDIWERANWLGDIHIMVSVVESYIKAVAAAVDSGREWVGERQPFTTVVRFAVFVLLLTLPVFGVTKQWVHLTAWESISNSHFTVEVSPAPACVWSLYCGDLMCRSCVVHI